MTRKEVERDKKKIEVFMEKYGEEWRKLGEECNNKNLRSSKTKIK